MTYLKKILQFAKPYKRFAILNIISNVFYALFSTLAFISFIPMLRVLFQEEKPISTQPVWNGEFGNIKDFANDYSNYFLNQQVEQYGEVAALVSICITVIVLFFLKNLFNYLALYFIANLRNG
ncbi:MAG: ABC transporter ATP-binding protein, partial [Salegentibacter mishustinae]|nr:ABC transporter ATP-binding protein [Salegentibacter mishustinae]